MTKQTRSCKRESHPVLLREIVRCNACHSSQCFNHILDFNVHAAETVLLYGNGSDRRCWHRPFQQYKARAEELEFEYNQQETQGVRPKNHRFGLAMVAKTFRLCNITNPNVLPGWYDRVYDNLVSDSCAFAWPLMYKRL
jgi:hypothetical protein